MQLLGSDRLGIKSREDRRDEARVTSDTVQFERLKRKGSSPAPSPADNLETGESVSLVSCPLSKLSVKKWLARPRQGV